MSADCGKDNAIRTPRPGAVGFRLGFITFSNVVPIIRSALSRAQEAKSGGPTKGGGRIGQVGRNSPVVVVGGPLWEQRAG